MAEMTPDQIFNLCDSAIKITGGAIGGGIGGIVLTWITLRHTSEMKNKEIDFDREKIRYERDKELIGRAIEHVDEMHQGLDELIKASIVVAATPTQKEYYDKMLSAMEERSRVLDLLNLSSSRANATLCLIGSDEVMVLFQTYRVAYAESYTGAMEASSPAEVNDRTKYTEMLNSKVALQTKLSTLFRSMI